ncbi:MAG: D-alanine--D-alanine ligase [Holosporales bacterium]|jgi:D-alanine-D-alanine ligase|nr:D-alanine--D-alanine ligase [Holosporales bacterium]
MGDSSSNICVIKGGTSSEREVSLISGACYASALRRLGYKVTEIDLTKDVYSFIEQLRACAPQVVVNALHGTKGEDGCMQGLMSVLGIAYTHSGVLPSSVAMNKHVTKNILESAGLACADGFIIEPNALLKQDPFIRPFVVKPNEEGSSIGVSIIRKDTDVEAIVKSWAFGDMLVERYIPGRELTVGLMGDKPLAVTEIVPVGTEFYNYKAKYTTDNMAKHLLPAPIHASAYDNAMDMASRAVKAVGCRGISRVDFRYNDTKGEPGDLYILEVNTQPGATELSLVPEQAKYLGVSIDRLVDWMVKQACPNK